MLDGVVNLPATRGSGVGVRSELFTRGWGESKQASISGIGKVKMEEMNRIGPIWKPKFHEEICQFVHLIRPSRILRVTAVMREPSVLHAARFVTPLPSECDTIII